LDRSPWPAIEIGNDAGNEAIGARCCVMLIARVIEAKDGALKVPTRSCQMTGGGSDVHFFNAREIGAEGQALPP